MFDFVHNSKIVQWGMKALLAAIAISFVAFTDVAYFWSGGGANEIARVGDYSISQQDLDRAMEKEQVNQDQAQAVLDKLVYSRALQSEAKSVGFVISDEELADAIANAPDFQKDGKFSMEMYQMNLVQRGQTPAQFEADLRHEMLAMRVQNLVLLMTRGGYYSRTAGDAISAMLAREREVSQVRFDHAAFLNSVPPVTDAEVAAYYKANQGEFRVAEKVKVEYILLTIPSLSAAVTVTDDEIKDTFEKNKERFERDERQARHILLTVAKDADAAAKAAARSKAEALLQQVKSNPAQFAELARSNSQDPGSAANGGELGWLTREGLDARFADALFALNGPGLTGVVESDFGFHIIEMTGARKTGLQEAREGIAAQLKEQKARRDFPRLSEELADLAVDNERNLLPVSQKTGLQLQSTDWMTSAGVEADPLFGPENKDVLERIFSADGLAGRATEVIELKGQRRLVARVRERAPARTQTLAEVTPQIRAKLQETAAVRMAEAEGKRVLAALSKGETAMLNWSPVQKVSYARDAGLSRDAIKQVLQAPATQPAGYTGVAEDKGYTLFRVGAFATGQTTPADAETRDFKRLVAEFQAFDKVLRRQWVESVKPLNAAASK